MSHVLIKSALLVAGLAALSACGGGGGATPGQYPLDTAFSAFNQMSHDYHLAGSSGGDNYTLRIIFAPGPQGNFNGVQTLMTGFEVIETKNGATVNQSTTLQFFLTNPYTQIGSSNGTDLTEVDGGQKPLPEFAEDGAKGTLDTQKYYSNPSRTTLVGTGKRTWTLTALTSDTAQFCIHDADNIGGPSESEIDCYTMDIKGNVTALEVTVTSGGQTIVFK